MIGERHCAAAMNGIMQTLHQTACQSTILCVAPGGAINIPHIFCCTCNQFCPAPTPGLSSLPLIVPTIPNVFECDVCRECVPPVPHFVLQGTVVVIHINNAHSPHHGTGLLGSPLTRTCHGIHTKHSTNQFSICGRVLLMVVYRAPYESGMYCRHGGVAPPLGGQGWRTTPACTESAPRKRHVLRFSPLPPQVHVRHWLLET